MQSIGNKSGRFSVIGGGGGRDQASKGDGGEEPHGRGSVAVGGAGYYREPSQRKRPDSASHRASS